MMEPRTGDSRALPVRRPGFVAFVFDRAGFVHLFWSPTMVHRTRTICATLAVLFFGFLAGWMWREREDSAQARPHAATPAAAAAPAAVALTQVPKDGKLRIIAFGAHPDDCELKAGGVAAKWAARGHHVKFVST